MSTELGVKKTNSAIPACSKKHARELHNLIGGLDVTIQPFNALYRRYVGVNTARSFAVLHFSGA